MRVSALAVVFLAGCVGGAPGTPLPSRGASSPPSAVGDPSPAASPTRSAIVAATPSASPSPSATAPGPLPSPYPHVAIEAPMGPFPLLARGSVWMASWDRGGIVVRVDTATNKLVATIPVGERPHAIGAHGSDIWVSSKAEGGVIRRIDPKTNRVAETIRVGAEGYAMAIVGDTLWLSSFEDSRVIRVDLKKRRVVADIPVSQPTGIAADEDGAWATMHYRGSVARIDAATNKVTLLDTGTAATQFLALVGDAVWVTTGQSKEIALLSRRTGEIVGSIAAEWPMGIIAHDGIVWVADQTDDLQKVDRILAFDAQTRRAVRELPLAQLDPYSLATDGKDLWVTAAKLLRIDLGD